MLVLLSTEKKIENPFMERSNGKQVAIGNWWSSKYFDGPQYVNSTDETITFNGVTIDAQTIQIADGRIYTFDEFDAIRQNLGIEPHSTRFDDYIDISSYKIEDFPNTGEWHFADIEATIGNDIYVGPDIKIDGRFVSVLDYSSYFHLSEEWNMDPSKVLEFSYLGDGHVKIIDEANGYETHAYNIYRVSAPEDGLSVIYGDSEINYLSSSGGEAIFHGGGGQDQFSISIENEDDEVEDRNAQRVVRIMNWGSRSA